MQNPHPIGAETLRRMSTLERYSLWVIERIRPWLGKRVIEVGSGIGNNSHWFLDAEKLVLSDMEESYLATLGERFSSHEHVEVVRFDLESSCDSLRDRGLDTVVAFNVLEHIEDDINALDQFHGILEPGGRVILQLPAHPLLYGSLDRHLDHFRRYTVDEVRSKFRATGFEPLKFFHMNMPGALGWFVSSRILKQSILPESALSAFNILTPAFMTAERFIPPPFGLSIIAIGEKERLDGP